MIYNYIELFAGCGGMSLGLEAAGFKLFFANELSPMAGETYAFNLLGEDLRKSKEWQKTLWISSAFTQGEIKRLSEDPSKYSQFPYRELYSAKNLNGKLIIGDIVQLNDYLKKNTLLTNKFKSKISLVSGGPPCQSFSLAGKREKDNRRNNLPWAFAEFVEIIQPKIVLLENVSGILRPFKVLNEKYYAWFEVAKAFALKGYVPICMHINAKYYGIPQNRPRFVLLGIRRDLLKREFDDEVLMNSISFFELVKKRNAKVRYHDANFRIIDLTRPEDAELFFHSPFLPKPKFLNEIDFLSVGYAIDGLKNLPDQFSSEKVKNDPYHKDLAAMYLRVKRSKGLSQDYYTIKNHEFRLHNKLTQERFKFYRAIQLLKSAEQKQLSLALRQELIVMLDKDALRKLSMVIPYIVSNVELNNFLVTHRTKKHSQRPLFKDDPAPAALSIPDDVCHYDQKHDRTLSIREMARIQSFPDWFEFRAKDTTGGVNRRHEIPNYTQVGNAVPPMLAKELGLWIKKLLKLIEDEI